MEEETKVVAKKTTPLTKPALTLRDAGNAIRFWWISMKRGLRPAIQNVDWLSIPVGTYVRWIICILVLLNTILSVLHINPIAFSESEVYTTVSVILNGVILITNTYKNNSTSNEAIYADNIMTILKSIDDVDTKSTVMENINSVLEKINQEQ